jgi:putative flippase GtrA
MNTRPRPALPIDSPGAPRSSTWRQVRSFVVIGVVSTLAYVILYSLLRGVTGPALANGLALVATAIANTAANRRLTFEVRSRDGLARDHVAGLIAFAVALGITTLSIALLGRLAPNSGRTVELAVLVVANGLATVVRFVLLRSWIDRPRSVPATTATILERTAR